MATRNDTPNALRTSADEEHNGDLYAPVSNDDRPTLIARIEALQAANRKLTAEAAALHDKLATRDSHARATNELLAAHNGSAPAPAEPTSSHFRSPSAPTCPELPGITTPTKVKDARGGVWEFLTKGTLYRQVVRAQRRAKRGAR